MKCPECNEKLMDYLYHDLSPEEERAMDEHFKSCEHCAKELSQFQLVRTSFQQLKKTEVPALVHQKILAHAREESFKEKRSWMTALFFKPSTATVMAVLLAIGLFYYTQKFNTIEMDAEKTVVKVERGKGGQEKMIQIDRVRPLRSESFTEKKMESSFQEVKGGLSQMEETPSAVALISKPPVSLERVAIQEPPKDLNQMVRALSEEMAEGQESSFPSKDVLYTFEMGNHYYAHNEFEKAVTSYSLALMMHPQGAYADTIRYQLATSYKKLNDCNSAVKVLDEIQKRYPNYPEIDKVMLMAGDCYMDLRAYDKAESNYADFIRMYPDRELQVADKLETARKFRRVNLSY